MTRFRWLAFLTVTVQVVVVLAAAAVAQERQPVDPWQYPSLVKSKDFQRWWWAFQQRAYPLGYIPANAKLRALEQIERTKASQPEAAAAAISGTAWFNIGPAPEQDGQIGATGGTRPMSGRVTAVAEDPGNGDHWLIGGAQGGVWETRDGGGTWTAKTDAQASLAMGAIAFAPGNPSIVYAGTGEASFSADSYAGAGLLKSTDGGNTWTLFAAGTFAQSTFSAIRVDPNNPDILEAGTTFGVAGRAAVIPPGTPATGIFRSVDGGVSWTQTRSGDATDLAADPTNFNNQYAGMGDQFSDPANNLVRSTDGGQTWTVITGPWTQEQVGRIALAIAPSNPGTLYVAIQRAFGSGGGDAEGALLGLFRTDDAWAPTPTFISIPQAPSTGGFGFCGFDLAFGDASQQCSYDMLITVDPADSNTLYAGGIQLWKCTACGASPTWAEISKNVSNPAQGIHVDQHSSAWAGARLIVGNDGGVWSSGDGGGTWLDHNTTLSLTQFYDGSIHPTNPNFALGGAQDNGTMKWTGAGAWLFISGGDGAANAISSSTPNTSWAVSAQNLSILRTTNAGASFIQATSGINRSDAPFIGRFEKCPADDNRFIAGTSKIWRTTNFFSAGSPSWVDNNTPGSFGSGISALAFAPSDTTCGTYAFATRAGSVGITPTGGTSWATVTAGTSLPGRAMTDLAFHPADPNTLYVTLSGFDEGTPGQPGHVFKTSNALAPSPVWTNVSPPVNLPHNAIAIDPTDGNILYVGTDLGVWTSADGGASWTHMGPEVGMPNVAVFDLKINAATNRLVAFTHGRGAFALSSTPPTLFSSVLPASRSVQVGALATVFATIINAGVATATGVNISLATGIPANFSAQTTDPLTNRVTGPPDTAVDIPGGQSQTYLLSITPTSPVAPADLQFNFAAANAPSAQPLTGINTLLFSASTLPGPDVIALVATSPNDGIVRIPGTTGTAAFAVATSNVGAGAMITASSDTGSFSVPVTLSICQTNPVTGVCLAAAGPSVTTQIDANTTPTFGIFVRGTGTAIPLDPAKSRVFVRFKDAGGATRGSTSVAVRTQ
jgi:hypothetical protein